MDAGYSHFYPKSLKLKPKNDLKYLTLGVINIEYVTAFELN